MICRVCEGHNRDEARFCKFCGAEQRPRCRACGTDLDEDARFCDACGAPVASQAGAAPAAPGTPHAARKTVTVLFADMTGSTGLEERLDAESVRTLIDSFYAALRTDVERHGGRVVKLTGDGLMAAFGVPEVGEDDAVRAVEAAVAMCATCEALAARTGHAFGLKVGVNTGEVVVLDDDDDVVGDAVNVAKRLEGAASEGEVLVGGATWRLVRSRATFDALAPLEVKGRAEPVEAFKLISLDAPGEAAPAPFIGRAREMQRLVSAFEDAVASSAARLVTIVGSPGVGKTRLTRELAAALAGRAVVREARCEATAAATFSPIADALRDTAAISDTAGEAEVVAALTALVPPGEPDRERIAARAAAIFGVGEAGSTEETFWALRRMLEATSRERPRVVILDDLHWAEPLMLDLVEHLAEWIRDAPVLLVGTGRPELRDLRPSLTEGGRPADVIALEGLDDQSTATLALGLLGAEDAPAELLARIPAATQGNPLFVREFVRMLVDDGVLRRDGERWTITVDVDAVQVPPTIQSLLAARVDRLRPEERTLIELASVVGHEFYRGAVFELAPDAVRDRFDVALESLRRSELVEPAGTYWIDEPVYTFHHVLVRDAAYRRLLKESRADLHARVADWFAGKTRNVLGEHEELVGYHLEQAHEYGRQLGRADDAVGRRAAELLGAAARRALDRDDLPAAAALSGRALQRLATEAAERAELLLTQCEALLSTGDVAGASSAVAELENVAATPRLQSWAGTFASELAALVSPERLEDVERDLASSAVRLQGLGDLAGAAKAHTVRATTLGRLGRFVECESVLDDALAAAREAGDRRRITACLSAAMVAAVWGATPVSRAGGRCLDLVRLSRITTKPRTVEVTSLRCQAVLEAYRGRADAARRMLDDARRTLTEMGLRSELLETERFAGIVELLGGDVPAAIRSFRLAYDGFRDVGIDVNAALSAALLARAHLMLGEDGKAGEFASAAERLAGVERPASIQWRAVKATLLARRGESDAAVAMAREAVALGAAADAPIDHAGALFSLAEVCDAAGDAEGARTAREQADAIALLKGATAMVGLHAEAATGPSASVPAAAWSPAPNRCMRVQEELLEAVVRQDKGRARTLLDDGFVRDDRRAGLRNVIHGPDEYLASVDAFDVVGYSQAALASRGERLVLTREQLRVSRPGEAGESFGRDALAVSELDENGLSCARVLFDPHDFDAAVEELDRRFVAGDGGPAWAGMLEMSRGVAGAISRRDFDALAAFYAPGYVEVDHRPVSLGEVHGAAATEATTELFSGLDDVAVWCAAVEAAAPERCVWRWSARGSKDGAAVGWDYLLVHVFAGGVGERIEIFPDDGLDAAMRRFRELGGDKPMARVDNSCVRVIDRFCREYFAPGSQRDASPFFAHAYTVDDRRRGLRSVEHELTSRFVGVDRLQAEAIAVRGDDLALFHVLRHHVGGWEQEMLAVHELGDDGRIRASVVFDVTDLDAALGELGARAESHEVTRRHARPWLTNACVRVIDRFCREYFAPGSPRDDAREFFAESLVVEDRRLGLRSVEHELTSRFEGVARLDADVVAVRGDDLALFRFVRHHEDGWEVESLAVHELGDDGRVVRAVGFDAADMDAAFEELDTRWLARDDTRLEGLGIGDHQVAVNRRDWDAWRPLWASDVVVVDHRPAGWGTLHGLDAWTRHTQALVDVIPDLKTYTLVHHAATRAGRVVTSLQTGTNAEGGRVDIEYVGVMLTTGGVRHRLEVFPAHDVDEALARFEDLTRATVTNACVRLFARVASDVEEGREPSPDYWSESFVVEDRRRGLRSVETEVLSRFADVQRLDIEPVAVRGDRLELCRVVRRYAEDWEVELLVVHELDDDGRFAVSVAFDHDDLDAAFEELDRRWLAREGAAYAGAGFGEHEALSNRRDWDSWRLLWASDVVVVDHRPAGWGTVHGLEAWIRHTHALREVIPDVKTYTVAYHALAPSACVVTTLQTGTNAQGGRVDIGFVRVLLTRGGVRHRLEVFPAHDVDAALARFEELTHPTVTNACVRLFARVERDIGEGRQPSPEYWSESFVVEDRRRGLRSVETEVLSRFAGLERMDVEPVAVRGERLELCRVERRYPGGWEVPSVAVHELGDDGRLAATVVFDPDDLDAAFEELDRRYAAGEAARFAGVWRAVVEHIASGNRQDWDAMRATLNDDAVLLDLRPAAFGTVDGADAIVRLRREAAVLTPDRRETIVDVQKLTSSGAAIVSRVAAHNAYGGAVEWSGSIVLFVAVDRVCRVELFGDDAVAAAARLEDW